jgi:hypothetical protein
VECCKQWSLESELLMQGFGSDEPEFINWLKNHMIFEIMVILAV